jgi:hypothetical protein
VNNILLLHETVVRKSLLHFTLLLEIVQNFWDSVYTLYSALSIYMNISMGGIEFFFSIDETEDWKAKNGSLTSHKSNTILQKVNLIRFSG